MVVSYQVSTWGLSKGISGQSMINLPKSYVYTRICEQTPCMNSCMNVNKITVCYGVCACAYNTVTRCVVISELVMPWMFCLPTHYYIRHLLMPWSMPTLADRLTLLHIRHLPICRVCPTIHTHHWSCRLWPFTPQLNLFFHVHACTQAYYLTQYQRDEAFLYHVASMNINIVFTLVLEYTSLTFSRSQ